MIITDIEGISKWSNICIDVTCDVCSRTKTLKYKLYTSYGYIDGEYLCRTCKLKKNNLEKYGVENVFQLDNVKNKIKETVIEKWGVDNISKVNDIKKKKIKTSLIRYGFTHHLKNENILKKQIDTNLINYGVDNVSKSEGIKNKKIITSNINNGVDYIFQDSEYKNELIIKNKELYGVTYSLSSKIIRDKIVLTNIAKYGFDNPAKNDDIKYKIKQSVLKKLHKKILENPSIISIDTDNRLYNMHCDYCDSDFTIGYFLFYKRRETNTTICTICNVIDKHQSGKEIQLQQFISSNYDGPILFNTKIEKKEMDIFLPDLGLAFEFNGIYWHSEIYCDRNYHKNKTDICRQNGIQLIHIWEDDWEHKTDIIKSMICNKLGKSKKVFARKCVIKEIDDTDIVRNFLIETHLQGYAHSTIKLGLYFNNELVSIMCFKKTKEVYDLNRFSTVLNTSVIGGASKLLNYFRNKYNSVITTFSDNAYSDGDLYRKLGFKVMYVLKPDYKYIDNGIRVHKFNYRNKTDLIKIYDAGKVKFII